MSGGISDSWTSVIYALSTTNLHGNITWTASAAVAWNRNGCASGDGRLPPGSAPRKVIAQTFSWKAQPNDGNPSDAAPGRGADAERADDAWTRPPGQCHPPPAHNLGSDNRSRFGLPYFLVMAQPIGFLFSISPCFKQTQEQAEWQLVTPLFLT